MAVSLDSGRDYIRRHSYCIDTDFLLIEVDLQAVFFGAPETQFAAGVANFIDPMLFRIESARRREPRTLGLAFASPAAELADHARMKRFVERLGEGLSKIVAVGEQDLSDERHLQSLAVGVSQKTPTGLHNVLVLACWFLFAARRSPSSPSRAPSR